MTQQEFNNHYTIFKDNQGSGYVFENPTDIFKFIEPVTVNVGSETLLPGDMTNLDNYLTQKVKYLGTIHGNGMIFYYCSDNNLFPNYFYGLIFLLSKDRIFEMFGPKSGRDHNFKNGIWK